LCEHIHQGSTDRRERLDSRIGRKNSFASPNRHELRSQLQTEMSASCPPRQRRRERIRSALRDLAACLQSRRSYADRGRLPITSKLIDAPRPKRVGRAAATSCRREVGRDRSRTQRLPCPRMDTGFSSKARSRPGRLCLESFYPLDAELRNVCRRPSSGSSAKPSDCGRRELDGGL